MTRICTDNLVLYAGTAAAGTGSKEGRKKTSVHQVEVEVGSLHEKVQAQGTVQVVYVFNGMP